MKKIISTVLVCVLMLGTMLALASCSNISEKYAEKINHKTLEESVGGFKKALSGKGFSVHINFSNKGKVLICGTYLNLQTESLVYLMQMIQKLKPGI